MHTCQGCVKPLIAAGCTPPAGTVGRPGRRVPLTPLSTRGASNARNKRDFSTTTPHKAAKLTLKLEQQTVTLQEQTVTLQDQLCEREAEVQRLEAKLADVDTKLETVEIELINAQEDSKAFEEENEKILNDYNELQQEGKELHRAYLAKNEALSLAREESAVLRELVEVKVSALGHDECPRPLCRRLASAVKCVHAYSCYVHGGKPIWNATLWHGVHCAHFVSPSSRGSIHRLAALLVVVRSLAVRTVGNPLVAGGGYRGT